MSGLPININDRLINTRMGTAMLMEIVNAAAYAKQLGISDSDFGQLVRMNARELRNIADSGIFQVQVDTRALNRAVQRVLHRRDEHTLIEDAIKLGASKGLLHDYAGLSFKQYNDLIAELNIDGQNGRPPMLTDAELSNLADHHARYGQSNPIRSKKDHLRCLVYLAKHTNIDIKRIYNYFYADNSQLYETAGGDA